MAKRVDQCERYERATVRVNVDAEPGIPTPCRYVVELFGAQHDRRMSVAERWACLDEYAPDEKPESLIGLSDSNAPDLPAA